ncbi:hypothetical protein IGI86_002699 [Enterococcus sp. AZ188]|uniref:hypothetical protein n=1 Tax=Enterococcus sp. AZ188 TaxID=2774678 RepID=UPI003D2FA9A9
MKLKLKLTIDSKIFHLVVIWFIFFATCFALYLERGGYLTKRDTEIISNVVVYLIAIELTIILVQAVLFISSFVINVYFDIQTKKREKIETNTFFWISEEKIGDVTELITVLGLRGIEFDNDCDKSLNRYSYIKNHIRNSLSPEDIKLWHSQLKVKDKDITYISFLIASIISFSAIKEIFMFIPVVYEFLVNNAPYEIVGRIIFIEIILLIIVGVRGLLKYVKLDSRLTNFFTTILNDLIEENPNS